MKYASCSNHRRQYATRADSGAGQYVTENVDRHCDVGIQYSAAKYKR